MFSSPGNQKQIKMYKDQQGVLPSNTYKWNNAKLGNFFLWSGAKLFIIGAISSWEVVGDFTALWAILLQAYTATFSYLYQVFVCVCLWSCLCAQLPLYKNKIIPWQYLLCFHEKVLTETFYCKWQSIWDQIILVQASILISFTFYFQGGGGELNMRKWKNTSTLNKIRILHHMTCIPKRF